MSDAARDEQDVSQELKDLDFQFQGDVAGHFSSDAVVAGLVQLQDNHPEWSQGKQWPGAEERKYHETQELPKKIAGVLVRGFTFIMKKVKLSNIKILFLNQDNWASSGKLIRYQVKKTPAWALPIVGYRTTNAIIVNHQFWVNATALQRIAIMLDALMEVAGFSDDERAYNRYRLCGVAVFEEDVALWRAMSTGAQYRFDGQLSLLESEGGAGPDEEEGGDEEE